MSNTFFTSKIKHYIAKSSTNDDQKGSILNYASENTQSQLSQYKESRKLPLLGTNWRKIGEKPLLKRDRMNVSNSTAPLEYIVSRKASKDISSHYCSQSELGEYSVLVHKESESLTLEQMLQEYNKQQQTSVEGDNYNFLSPHKVIKLQSIGNPNEHSLNVYKDENPIFEAENPNYEDEILSADNINTHTSQSALSNQHMENVPSKPIINSQKVEYASPNKFIKNSPIKKTPRSRSRSLPETNKNKFRTNADDNREKKLNMQTEVLASRESFRTDKLFNSPASQSKQMLRVRSRGRRLYNESRDDIHSSQFSMERDVSNLTLNNKDSNDSCDSSSEKERGFNETINETLTQEKVFQDNDILESTLPLTIIEHPNIPKIKALQPNYVLAARPLRIPLTGVIENALKDVYSKTKKGRARSLVDKYGKSLLRGTYEDYFRELNPLGRLKIEEITLLNGLNDAFRSRRGLTASSNHSVEKAIADRSPEVKLDKKSKGLLKKLRQAYNNNGDTGEIIKDHRKDMPIDLSRQFLESSFDKIMKSSETRNTITAKMKRYDAWYVPPDERFKNFTGIFTSSKIAKDKFKHYQNESINPVSIRRVSRQLSGIPAAASIQ